MSTVRLSKDKSHYILIEGEWPEDGWIVDAKVVRIN